MGDHRRVRIACVGDREAHRRDDLEQTGEIREQSEQGGIGGDREVGLQTRDDRERSDGGELRDHLPIHDRPERIDVTILHADLDQADLTNEEDEHRDRCDDQDRGRHDVGQDEDVFEGFGQESSVVGGHLEELLQDAIGDDHLSAGCDRPEDGE